MSNIASVPTGSQGPQPNTYDGVSLNSASEMTVTGNRSGDNGTGTRQRYGVNETGLSNTNLIVGNMVQRNSTGGINTIGAATSAASNL